jgi:putative endonuclease
MEPRTYWVYILASQRNGTLYIGVSNNLAKRVFTHKEGWVDGFTKRYGVHMLVHAEPFHDITVAIKREKQLKKWNRAWKIALIEKGNPNWKDLYQTLPV